MAIDRRSLRRLRGDLEHFALEAAMRGTPPAACLTTRPDVGCGERFTEPQQWRNGGDTSARCAWRGVHGPSGVGMAKPSR